MGESATETVREIEQTRDRLEDEFRELEQRLPAPGRWAKRLIGVAVGGGVGGSAFWFAVRKLRKRRKQKAPQQQLQAVVNVVPERWAQGVSAALEDGRWKGWAAAAGGAWVLFRLAEIRQLRRMNRALIVAR
jgi:hypothetical protein